MKHKRCVMGGLSFASRCYYFGETTNQISGSDWRHSPKRSGNRHETGRCERGRLSTRSFPARLRGNGQLHSQLNSLEVAGATA